MKRVLLLLAALSTSVSAQRPNPAAAPQAPPPVQSPDVQPDRRVTFRLRAPNAREVAVTREGAPRLAMQKDDQGIWSVTTEPLEPDLYGYSFGAGVAALGGRRRAARHRAPSLLQVGGRRRSAGFLRLYAARVRPGSADTLSGALPAARDERWRRRMVERDRPRERDPRQPDCAGTRAADGGRDAAGLRGARDPRARRDDARSRHRAAEQRQVPRRAAHGAASPCRAFVP